MAFDGIVIANLVKEFSDALTGGKIAKITQTERDELLFTIKNFRETKRLLLSVNASLPLAYLTDTNKQGPMTAPNFCMLLRKHIGSGRIVSVSQPGLERCIHFEIEHLDEMGDLCRKLLIVELMGKYSNIIFCSPDGTILDSIKHISVQVSSVREVLPGRQYFLPQTDRKKTTGRTERGAGAEKQNSDDGAFFIWCKYVSGADDPGDRGDDGQQL